MSRGLRQLPAEERLNSRDSSGRDKRLKGDTIKVYRVPQAVDKVKVELLYAQDTRTGSTHCN